MSNLETDCNLYPAGIPFTQFLFSFFAFFLLPSFIIEISAIRTHTPAYYDFFSRIIKLPSIHHECTVRGVKLIYINKLHKIHGNVYI